MSGDSDRPFGPFEGSGTLRFKNAAIEAAVVEVRFSGSIVELTEDDAMKMLRAFADFGVIRMEPSQQNQVQFLVNAAAGTSASSQTVVARGWQFSNHDRSCVFNVTARAASAQVSKYERWSVSLLPQFTTLLEVIQQVCGARVIERTGLRYINRFTQLDANGEWIDIVAVPAAGLLRDPKLGKLFTSSQQHAELSIEPEIGAVLRHGPLPGIGTGYLMDIDIFDVAARELVTGEVLQRAQRLNRTAFALFRQLLSPNQLDEMTSLDDVVTGGAA